MSPFLEVCSERFSVELMDKLKMIIRTDLTQTVKMNELFSPAASA